MWIRSIVWWPVFWSQLALSCWQHGVATNTAMLAAVRQRPLPERKLRTPLLTSHVGTLKPMPRPARSVKRADRWLRSV